MDTTDINNIADKIKQSSTIWAYAMVMDTKAVSRAVVDIVDTVNPDVDHNTGDDVAAAMLDGLGDLTDSLLIGAVADAAQTYADDCRADEYGRTDGLWKWPHEVNLHA